MDAEPVIVSVRRDWLTLALMAIDAVVGVVALLTR